MAIDPALASRLADAILLLHLAVVAFVVVGEALILFGGWRGWHWVRHRGLRIAHLALIGFIAVQTWSATRSADDLGAGTARSRRADGYREGFIEHGMSALLYVSARGGCSSPRIRASPCCAAELVVGATASRRARASAIAGLRLAFGLEHRAGAVGRSAATGPTAS